MPIREGYADKVFIVTSGENMSIYAAANIALAVDNFKQRGYADLGGIILNQRNVEREQEKVEELAKDIHTKIIGCLPFHPLVQQAEKLNKTVMEAFPDSDMAKHYEVLALQVLKACNKESDNSKAAAIPLPAQPRPGVGPPASTQRTPLYPTVIISSKETALPLERKRSRTVFTMFPS